MSTCNRLLVSVIHRALEDIKSKRDDRIAYEALLWIQGESMVRGQLDSFMEFKNLCHVLGLPYSLLRNYAVALKEGKDVEFTDNIENIVWPDDNTGITRDYQKTLLDES